ncbi:MAG: F0F1 ATP synthase subunit epsilon [Nitrospirota bacterium]|nr:F0F1 ATP synthase subunit epsilon [Nitrospirota bacterium]
MAEKIKLDVVTPTRTIVSEEVDEVTAPGADGEFGVLPGHAPFLTTLKAGELSYRKGSEKKFVSIIWGFADVHGDKMIVLAEKAETSEEIDVDRADAARRRAEERLAAATEAVDRERAEKSLERAKARLEVARKK